MPLDNKSKLKLSITGGSPSSLLSKCIIYEQILRNGSYGYLTLTMEWIDLQDSFAKCKCRLPLEKPRSINYVVGHFLYIQK